MTAISTVRRELGSSPSAKARLVSAAALRTMLETLDEIGRIARSDGQRTFDECIRDLGRIDDLYRSLGPPR